MTDKGPPEEGNPNAKWIHGQHWSNRDALTNLDSERGTCGT